MNLRSLLGTLQIPVATGGVLLVVFSAGALLTMPSPPPESEGFVAGLAVLVLYFLAWVGILVTALGFALPPGDSPGITFTRAQRSLFLVAAAAGLVSAIGPFVAFGVLLSNPSLMGTTWVALMGVAVIALLTGLIWRGAQAVHRWRLDGGSSPASNS